MLKYVDRIPEKGGSGRVKLVLVCDDSMYVRHALVSMLSGLGFRAILASNAEEGMALIRSFEPDLVISEIDLPLLDGMELFRTVREDLALADTPWIAMSAPGRRKEALRAGCAHFLPKPVKARVLEQVVYQALSLEAKNYV